MESNERDEAIDNIQEQLDAGYEPDEIDTVDQQIEADRDAEKEYIRDEIRDIGRESGVEGEA